MRVSPNRAPRTNHHTEQPRGTGAKAKIKPHSEQCTRLSERPGRAHFYRCDAQFYPETIPVEGYTAVLSAQTAQLYGQKPHFYSGKVQFWWQLHRQGPNYRHEPPILFLRGPGLFSPAAILGFCFCHNAESTGRSPNPLAQGRSLLAQGRNLLAQGRIYWPKADSIGPRPILCDQGQIYPPRATSSRPKANLVAHGQFD